MYSHETPVLFKLSNHSAFKPISITKYDNSLGLIYW